MSSRTRKNFKAYQRYRRRPREHDCDFCHFTLSQDQVLKSYKHFWLVKNIFPLDIWDTAKVKDHLLLIPKRHIDSVGHFTKEEQALFSKVVGEYDLKGYSIYARARGNVGKTVIHQHTHLIAIENRQQRFLLYLKKPRLLLFK